MTDAEQVRLVELIDEAAADPSLWPVFLQSYAQAIAAKSTLLQVHYFSEHRSEILACSGLLPKQEEQYDRYYSRLNVWRESGFHVFVQGRVVVDAELCPREELKRSEFYNDYLRRLGCAYSMGGTILRDRKTAMNLTSLREGPWDEKARQFSESLLPHLKRATTMQRRLAVLEAGGILLDQHELGIVMLAADRKAVYVNKSADAIFNRRDGLALFADALVASNPQANTMLQGAINCALSHERSIDCPEVVPVPQASLMGSYYVFVGPIRERLAPFVGLPLPAVVVLIFDPGDQRPASAGLFQKIYGLTAREAQIARGLCDGKALETIANEMKMTYETARTHLKRIFSKTGTSRQAELVAQLLRVPSLLFRL